jgi:hypothetical protein
MLKSNLGKQLTNTHPDFDLFLDILKVQPTWKRLSKKITSFNIFHSKVSKAILLQVQLDYSHKWMMVSWKRSFNGNKKINYIQSAFRYAIRHQIKEWKLKNQTNYKCVHCNSMSTLQADHEIPSFINLTRLFIHNNNNIPMKFDFHTYGTKFRTEDTIFCRGWIAFHKKHSKLQWLCKSCNLKKR